MSSMEFNKLSGAILLGGLIAMMTGFIAEVLVEPKHLEEVRRKWEGALPFLKDATNP